jgi:glutathione S-transferase
MSELTLYADDDYVSPWVFHAMVALEELKVSYELKTLHLPIEPAQRAELQRHAVLGKVPCLRDGELWLTESSAISEYLHERFGRLYPKDAAERARARQVLSWLRTSMMPLREDRPTSSVFGKPVHKPLSDKARGDASELVRIAEQLVPAGRQTIASEWCIADADLALMLMRLVANGDAVPERIAAYTRAQWSRPCVQAFLARVPK